MGEVLDLETIPATYLATLLLELLIDPGLDVVIPQDSLDRCGIPFLSSSSPFSSLTGSHVSSIFSMISLPLFGRHAEVEVLHQVLDLEAVFHIDVAAVFPELLIFIGMNPGFTYTRLDFFFKNLYHHDIVR